MEKQFRGFCFKDIIFTLISQFRNIQIESVCSGTGSPLLCVVDDYIERIYRWNDVVVDWIIVEGTNWEKKLQMSRKVVQ